MFYPSYKSQIKTSAKAVLEEGGGAAAVEASLRDDRHPVAQQICLIHVVGGHNDCAPCNTGKKRNLTEIFIYFYAQHMKYTQLISYN